MLPKKSTINSVQHSSTLGLFIFWLLCWSLLMLSIRISGQQTANNIQTDTVFATTSNIQSVCSNHFEKFHQNHTVCLEPNKHCKITKHGISIKEQQQILDIHNYYRNFIASGNESGLGFPSAANMLTLEWDNELAFVAQKHANQCRFEHDCYDCRRTERYPVVGQNLYIYRTTRTSAKPQWQKVIKEWYEEIKIAPPVVASSFDLFQLNIGHFTQIVWADTNKIGCGFSIYANNKLDENPIFKTVQLYTCNYAPAGNYLGEKMYENGAPSSKCPYRYSQSKHFHALCEFVARSQDKPKTDNRIQRKQSNKINDSLVTTIMRTNTRTTTSTKIRSRTIKNNNNFKKSNNSASHWKSRLNNWKNSTTTTLWKWKPSGTKWKKWLTNFTQFTNWTQWSKPSRRIATLTLNSKETSSSVDTLNRPMINNVSWSSTNTTLLSNWPTTGPYTPSNKQWITNTWPTIFLGYQWTNETSTPYNWSRFIDLKSNRI